MSDAGSRGRLFWPALATGWGVISFGVYGLFAEANRTHPDQWVRWFLGALIVHDFLVAPLTFGAGVVLPRYVSPRVRAYVQGSLIVSALVAVTAWPFVGGYGRRPDNPSILPGNYILGLAVLVALVWMVAGVLAWRGGRRLQGDPRGGKASRGAADVCPHPPR